MTAGEPAVSPTDRGFTYGDGLFETMRVSQGRPLFIGRHLARLFTGLQSIGFPALPWDKAALRERCATTIAENELVEGVLRLTVTRGTGPRGFEPPRAVTPTLVVQTIPASPRAPAGSSEGVRASLVPWKIDPASPLCYVKHLSALDKVLARQLARQAGADEALFLNLEGCLTEGAASNLFLAINGELLTPGVRCGLLPGIARGLLLESAAALGCTVAEAELPLARLQEAEEAFLTNAVMGVRPLVAVEGKAIGDGQPGPLTARAAGHYRRLCEAEAGGI